MIIVQKLSDVQILSGIPFVEIDELCALENRADDALTNEQTHSLALVGIKLGQVILTKFYFVCINLDSTIIWIYC